MSSVGRPAVCWLLACGCRKLFELSLQALTADHTVSRALKLCDQLIPFSGVHHEAFGSPNGCTLWAAAHVAYLSKRSWPNSLSTMCKHCQCRPTIELQLYMAGGGVLEQEWRWLLGMGRAGRTIRFSPGVCLIARKALKTHVYMHRLNNTRSATWLAPGMHQLPTVTAVVLPPDAPWRPCSG